MATQNAIGSNKPIEIAFGGTGVTTLTDHGVLLGSGTGAITPTAVGATGEVLVGATGADASWSASPTLTSVLATTFDTNVAAAGVTLAGTTLSADGSDTNININITAKGTGQVIIDDLQLTTDLAVTEGGTGASTLTDHCVLIGSGTGAVTPITIGTNGQVLLGSTTADPVFATLTSANGGISFTTGAGTLAIEATGTVAINAQTGTTYELVATDAGKLVTCSNAAAIALTIPVNADVSMPVGCTVLIAQKGAGIVTLTPEGGVTLRSRGAVYTTSGQYALVSVTKVATDEWYCGGDLA
jgi:hypothetical protein